LNTTTNSNNSINSLNLDSKKINEEYFISPDIQDLFSGNNQFLLNNFINFKSVKTFLEFLEEYIKQLLHKQKSINMYYK